MILTTEQMTRWHEDGFLHLRSFGPSDSTFSDWTDELYSWPETAGKWMKYFEPSVDGSNQRQLCRIEHFLEYHEQWKQTIESPILYQILEQLFGEPAVLFKEKINFKLPHGNGFSAHQDAPAFTSFGQRFHITAMLSIDASNQQNGCLEMAKGGHKRGLLKMTESLVITDEVVQSLEWEPVETSPGDLLLFGSLIPHRSGPNSSAHPRRAAYITYNPKSSGSHRHAYYQRKRETFPPEIERIPGRDYSNSGVFNVGNPIAPAVSSDT